jgi:hypothetical protein
VKIGSVLSATALARPEFSNVTGTEFKCWLKIWNAASNYICELSLAGKRDTLEARWLRHLWWSKELNPV